ncbi:MAG: tRNA 2-thiouridine(34) synthase MnmA [Peptococcaceae bacterium]|nr:tRNA 2-thiouridine(34) synthase MnmA [Peptococcaceae bacterium]
MTQIEQTQKKPVVALGMSGGVDSSVAVHLLQKAGYEVYGIHMLMIPEKFQPNPTSQNDAKAVAEQFGIKFTVLDVRGKFEECIIQQFGKEYSCGRTPNPCINCNQQLKFGLFADAAKSIGADYISTGHYVRTEVSEYSRKLFHKAVDAKKDQSYFLSLVSPDVLERCVFPLGELSKDQVREIAREIGLHVAEKGDSQEICFIPDNDYKAFLKQILPPKAFKKGKVFHVDGSLLGNHDGIQNYTIGQRKGLGIALGKPAYVVALDAKKNSVILGDSEHLMHNQLTASQNNFFIELPLETPIEVDAKIRYRAQAAPAELLCHSDGTATVTFKDSQRAITPGQCVAYYKGDALIGGGIIETAQNV